MLAKLDRRARRADDPSVTFRTPRVPVRGGCPLLVTAGAAWTIAVAAGAAVLWDYSSRAGAPSASAARWPAGSALAPPDGRAVLVMFIHPRCPCTRASLRELEVLLARVGTPVDARAVFALPADAPPEWRDTDLWRRVREVAGVTVVADPGGREARRFGARTSGAVHLYDAEGALLFAGGITSGRGHEGDNAGRDAVVAHLRGGAGATRSSPVFGCALLDAPCCEAEAEGG